MPADRRIDSVNPRLAPVAGNAAAGGVRLSRQDGVKPEEADLIDRCKRQEPGAFEELYRLHAGRVYNLACRLTGCLSEGEDLMQDVFVQVFRKLDGFKGESAVGTWIYRLATNQCLDYLRGREAKARKLNDPIENEATLPVHVARPMKADRLDLERAIGRLAPGYRAAFVLHDVEGFEHQEVAEMLGIAEGTSKSQVHKARAKIREYLSAAAPVEAAGRSRA
jgi:RNA polymerase sigma-70 factor, ECF subfamily